MDDVQEDEEPVNSTSSNNKTVEKREAAGQVMEHLEFTDMLIMYNLCRYEQAREPSMTSVWCAVFEEEDLKVMEYYEELSYWYSNGYFYEINTQFACPLMENLVTSFKG